MPRKLYKFSDSRGSYCISLASDTKLEITFLGWSASLTSRVSREIRANEAEGGGYTAVLHIII